MDNGVEATDGVFESTVNSSKGEEASLARMELGEKLLAEYLAKEPTDEGWLCARNPQYRQLRVDQLIYEKERKEREEKQERQKMAERAEVESQREIKAVEREKREKIRKMEVERDKEQIKKNLR
ncbi:hypothetical protein AGMMS49531_09790 [Endomicrobiia bacterium]|nr:hypothetical protein AGMMS49531_09790 [Endomicrobiia bacterium]